MGFWRRRSWGWGNRRGYGGSKAKAKTAKKTKAKESPIIVAPVVSVSAARRPARAASKSMNYAESETPRRSSSLLGLETSLASTPASNNTNDENEMSLQSSSSLRMDEDFDIDKFLSNSNEEETDVGLSNAGTEISDEDFLKQFPEIDLNQDSLKVKKPSVSKKVSKGADRSSIAEYAIVATPGTSAEQYSTTPSILSNKRKSVKRHLIDELENRNPKKPKIENSSKALHVNFGSSTPRSPLVNKLVNQSADQDYSVGESSEEDLNDTEDEDMDNDEIKDYDFPNLAEDINFDVSAIQSNLKNTFGDKIGDKRYSDFLRERHLTKECIALLHDSLIKTPTDAIERDPRGLAVQLMPHQRHALKWMRWREEQKPNGGILADDMGLGKTIELISLVLAAKNDKKAKAAAEGKAIDSDDDLGEDWGCDTDSREIDEGKTLVVCPASVIRQWEKEVQTKCRRGQLSVFVYHGPSRDLSQRKLAKYDIVVTTYNLVSQEYDYHIVPTIRKTSKLFKIKWERVILDEAHYIRNPKSKISIAACQLPGRSKWALTGTPIQNKEFDFYALLKFLKCSPFDELHVYKRWLKDNEDGHQRLVVITKTLMLRRTKAELMAKGAIQKLPERKFAIIEVEMDREERMVYQKLLLYSQSFFTEFLQQRKQKDHLKEFGCHMRPSLVRQEVPDKLSRLLKVLMKHHRQIEVHYILVLILRLRQMCCHPALIKSMVDKEDIDSESNGLQNQPFNEEMMDELNKLMSDNEDDDDEDCGINEKVAKKIMSKANPVFKNNRESSKVRAVLRKVQDILEKGEKVIVVSQWTGFLQVIANHLVNMEDAKFDMFSGQVAVKDRQEIIDRLNDGDNPLNVLLLSLTAGGVGLNLVGANHLLLIDLHWNPQLETQAQDRIYRFGQEKTVHIYKFICKDSIEEKIKLLQDGKLQIASNVLTGTVSNRLTIEDLTLLFS